jgi:hypothetical protein
MKLAALVMVVLAILLVAYLKDPDRNRPKPKPANCQQVIKGDINGNGIKDKFCLIVIEIDGKEVK